MTPPATPDDARDMARAFRSYDDTYFHVQKFEDCAAMLESLADQLEQVTRERDEAVAKLRRQHHVTCSNTSGEIGVPGCICAVENKHLSRHQPAGQQKGE